MDLRERALSRGGLAHRAASEPVEGRPVPPMSWPGDAPQPELRATPPHQVRAMQRAGQRYHTDASGVIDDPEAAVDIWTRLKLNLLPDDEDKRKVVAAELGLPLEQVFWNNGDLIYAHESGRWAKALPAIGDAPFFDNGGFRDMVGNPERTWDQLIDLGERGDVALSAYAGEAIPAIAGGVAASLAPTPVTAVPAAMAGAALGDLARQYAGKLLFLPEEDPTPDPLNVAGHALTGGAGVLAKRVAYRLVKHLLGGQEPDRKMVSLVESYLMEGVDRLAGSIELPVAEPREPPRPEPPWPEPLRQEAGGEEGRLAAAYRQTVLAGAAGDGPAPGTGTADEAAQADFTALLQVLDHAGLAPPDRRAQALPQALTSAGPPAPQAGQPLPPSPQVRALATLAGELAQAVAAGGSDPRLERLWAIAADPAERRALARLRGVHEGRDGVAGPDIPVARNMAVALLTRAGLLDPRDRPQAMAGSGPSGAMPERRRASAADRKRWRHGKPAAGTLSGRLVSR